jgi:hypothetical protein
MSDLTPGPVRRHRHELDLAQARRTVPRTSGGAGRGLLLKDLVAFDGEDAASLAQVEQLDQPGIDVQLMAVFAQSGRDSEAETFAPVRQSEGRIEARAHQTLTAAGAVFASLRHRSRPQERQSIDRFDVAMLGGHFQEPYDSLVPGQRYSVRSLGDKLGLEDTCARDRTVVVRLLGVRDLDQMLGSLAACETSTLGHPLFL